MSFDSQKFATRLQNVETSAIRELFKLLGKPGIISFAGGFPDPALFDVEGISMASTDVLRDAGGAVLQYGATEGYGPAKEAISRFMKAKGSLVEASELIVTTGSQQALDLLGKTLISPGDKIIVEAPTFLATIQCFKLYGAEIIGAPTDSNGVDVEALEHLIQEHQPKFVYLIPTFGNPSGATLTLERRKKVLDLALQYKTLVIEDDPYGELYFDQAPPPSLLSLSANRPELRDYLIHCGSFSKILSPGLRVGWLIAPAELLAKATMCKQFSDAHTSNLTQAIAARYLEMGRLDACLSKVRQVYAERAKTMVSGLQTQLGDAIEMTAPQGGMFVWAQLTQGRNSNLFAAKAIEQLVAFVPGAPFYAHTPNTSTLRLSFATANLSQIEEGISRMALALKAYDAER